jgi:hypothetical protein
MSKTLAALAAVGALGAALVCTQPAAAAGKTAATVEKSSPAVTEISAQRRAHRGRVVHRGHARGRVVVRGGRRVVIRPGYRYGYYGPYAYYRPYPYYYYGPPAPWPFWPFFW